MDNKDKEILRILQEDGRITNQDLAQRVNLSPSPCLRRVKQLEQSGVITGYQANVNAEAYGLPITVFAQVKLDKHSESTVKAFEQHVKLSDKVIDCYIMSGEYDYLLKVLVANLHDYEHFVRHELHTIGCIASIDTRFAYGTVKRAAKYPRS